MLGDTIGFRERIARLSAEQRDSLVRRLDVAQASDSPAETDSKRLVAFYVPANLEESVQPDDYLRSYLRQRLPEHMIPSMLVPLDRLPRTRTGKIDRRRLADLPLAARDSVESADDRSPRTTEEEELLEVWKEVFGFDEIRLTDNFFEIGGDSILSIQMTSLARKRGLALKPQDIFEYPTIESLALKQGSEASELSDDDPVSGPAFLLPIHHWFIENQKGMPDHWNMSRLFEIPTAVDAQATESMVRMLIEHHQVLRSRIWLEDDEWTLAIDSVSEALPFEVIVLEDGLETKDQDVHDDIVRRLQSSIRLSDGECVRFALLVTEADQPNHLSIVAHHAVVDLVSWQIIEHDLEELCRRVRDGQSLELPPRTTSARKWAEVLRVHADSSSGRAEVAYWERQGAGSFRLPRDLAYDGPNLEGDALAVRTIVPGDARELTDTALALDIRPHEFVLAAVAKSISEWANSSHVLLGIEGNGRQQSLDPDVDLTRTVGWLTTAYPVRIALVSASGSLTELFGGVAGQLRAVPGFGLGYGVLRYLSEDDAVRKRLSLTSQPDVFFNYFGTRRSGKTDNVVRSLETRSSHDRARDSTRPSLIEVAAGIEGDRLFVEWRYSGRFHLAQSVEMIAKRTSELLVQFAGECQQRSTQLRQDEIAGAPLSQGDLDKLMRSLGS